MTHARQGPGRGDPCVDRSIDWFFLPRWSHAGSMLGRANQLGWTFRGGFDVGGVDVGVGGWMGMCGFGGQVLANERGDVVSCWFHARSSNQPDFMPL